MLWNGPFAQTFWPSFFASFLGVLLSIGFSVVAWRVKKRYTDKTNRKLTKCDLGVEIRSNIKTLRKVREAISQAGSKGIEQFFSYYLDMYIYNAAVSNGYITLFPPLLQGMVHGTASIMQRFNRLLANVEAFAVHNRTLPSFQKELKIRCDDIRSQAEEFVKKIEDNTIRELDKQ